MLTTDLIINLSECEASPTRIRLSSYAAELLADMAERASHEVAD